MPHLVLYFILAGLGYLIGADVLDNAGVLLHS